MLKAWIKFWLVNLILIEGLTIIMRWSEEKRRRNIYFTAYTCPAPAPFLSKTMSYLSLFVFSLIFNFFYLGFFRWECFNISKDCRRCPPCLWGLCSKPRVLQQHHLWRWKFWLLWDCCRGVRGWTYLER